MFIGYSKDKREECIACMLCEKKVSFFCTTCKFILCDDCVVKHLRSKMKDSHYFVEFDIEDFNCYCDDHPQNKFVAFCECCNASICIICAFFNHKTHTVLELSDKIKELLRFINQGNDRLQRHKNKTQQVIEESPEEEEENMKNEAEVKKFEERMKKLNEIEKKSAKLQQSKNVEELQNLLSVIEETLKEFN